MEDKGEEEEEWVEGEVWEALFAGVLLELASFWEEGLGDEVWPQPARTVNSAREAERAPATFNAFPAFMVSSLLEVKRNITEQVTSFNKEKKGRPLRRPQKNRSFIPL